MRRHDAQRVVAVAPERLHREPRGLVVGDAERVPRSYCLLPQTVTKIPAIANAIKIFIQHKHMIGARVSKYVKLRLRALLDYKRFEAPRKARQNPGPALRAQAADDVGHVGRIARAVGVGSQRMAGRRSTSR